MPSYCVLRHELPPDDPRDAHFDLMLEEEDVLLTWELSQWPPVKTVDDNEPQFIHRLPDHRLDYLDYEGPVSKGRGNVSRVDSGTFEWLVKTGKQWSLLFNGKLCHGLLTFQILDPEHQRWMLSWDSSMSDDSEFDVTS